jgi:tRNA-binding EMAP/Myf-like protein
VVERVIVTEAAALFVTFVDVYDEGVTVAALEATVTEPTLGAKTLAVTLVAVAAPRDGVVSVGLVLRTTKPLPVED